MTEIKIKPAQGNWLEVTWVQVTQLPDVETPASPALYDAQGNEVQPAVEASTKPGGEKRTDLKHVSYHPTQLALLQADADAMGTPLTAHAAMLAAWAASYVPPAPEPTPVPQSVTRRQAKQALLLAGLLHKVQPAIDAIADPTTKAMVQIEWDDSQTFERHRPALVALAGALGMDDDALNKLFITATGL